MTATIRLSRNQRTYLDYISRNPGCSIAEIVRSCKRNPLAGHKWIYDSVHRLEYRGIVRIEGGGRYRTRCYLPGYVAE